MLKRKYGDRSEWKRIKERQYAQEYIETKEFQGYITLLHTISVTEPLSVTYGQREVCIVDDGYMWLQQFPTNFKHSVTTMFDAEGNIVQWYIDICLQNGVENHVPWMDDLFLDIIVLPSGELIEMDAAELDEALLKGIIDQPTYDLAWAEATIIKKHLNTDKFHLIKLSNYHKNRLLNILK